MKSYLKLFFAISGSFRLNLDPLIVLDYPVSGQNADPVKSLLKKKELPEFPIDAKPIQS